LSSIHTDTTIQKQYDLKTLLDFCREENLFDKALAYKNLLTKVFGVWNIVGIEWKEVRIDLFDGAFWSDYNLLIASSIPDLHFNLSDKWGLEAFIN
jgi:hypothetical protein